MFSLNNQTGRYCHGRSARHSAGFRLTLARPRHGRLQSRLAGQQPIAAFQEFALPLTAVTVA